MPQQFRVATIKDCPEGKVPVMTCEDIHSEFKDYAIQTTHKEVEETVEAFSKEPVDFQKFIFAKTLMRMVQWSDKELNEHYTNNNEEWKTFCDDVLDFYAVRYTLMKKPIPIFLQ